MRTLRGGVERLFGILQDRLVKELRLAGICTKEAANRFLLKYWPKYNRQFNEIARSSVDLHRPVPQEKDLKRVFSIREERTVNKDNTIQFKGKSDSASPLVSDQGSLAGQPA